jgi:riboflavin kinase/FMN adenylyltransferase
VATVGVFDGVHLGHQAVLGRARQVADEQGARLVAFSFDHAPQVVLRELEEAPRLTLHGEKVRFLRRAGADEVRILRFTRALASRSPEAFLAVHVDPFYALGGLIVGYDFAMGRRREGTVPVLRRLVEPRGVRVEAVEAECAGGEAISSTRIRNLLVEGEVEEAGRLLGRLYRLAGSVERGDARGRELGFPTANLAIHPEKQRPAAGVYAVWVTGSGAAGHPGVLNIGQRPTFGGGHETVEVHLIGFAGDLLGARLELQLAGKIRDERKFIDGNELKHQIRRDVHEARELLARAPSADN